MNASPPSLSQTRPHVAVIGAGPGGLAAAMLLASSGVRVTVFENNSEVRFENTVNGYNFDKYCEQVQV